MTRGKSGGAGFLHYANWQEIFLRRLSAISMSRKAAPNEVDPQISNPGAEVQIPPSTMSALGKWQFTNEWL
jgi:hypothetical protein